MNKFENQWIMFHEIHKRKREGHKISQIAKFLVMDKRTVKKYLAMSEQQFIDSQTQPSSRSKRLDEYEQFVKERIEACLDASSAQIHDWLKECHADFIEVSEKTVYNFVLHVREKHKLLLEFEIREFQKVPELPYGKQAQVDFGEFNMTNSDKQRKKVYFFSLVLARSRYKFVFFSDNHFTADTAIAAHEEAFKFIGGYPENVVYDQDRVFITDENKGNLILTDAFRDYHSSRPFELHFCRKRDPQSKGKVENVIKYIKYNFLRGRLYFDIHVLNGQAIEWLERTANAKTNSTTHLSPGKEWMIEKDHLKPLKEAFAPMVNTLPYKARKDNTVGFKGNFYSLPVGTYKGSDTIVFLMQENDDLIILDKDKQQIARHKTSQLKGKLVSNNNHYRDTSIAIKELIAQVALKFTDSPKAGLYLENIRQQYPRYVRDQVKMIQAICEKYTIGQCDQALEYCMQNAIYKTTDFEPVLTSLIHQEPNEPAIDTEKKLLKKAQYQVKPQTSNISDYTQILKKS
jgi:transposase